MSEYRDRSLEIHEGMLVKIKEGSIGEMIKGKFNSKEKYEVLKIDTAPLGEIQYWVGPRNLSEESKRAFRQQSGFDDALAQHFTDGEGAIRLSTEVFPFKVEDLIPVLN